jgi:hypothetical protein
MYSQKLKRENGFAHIAAIVFIILLLIIGAIGLKVHSEVQQSSRPASSTNDKLDAKIKELAAPTTAKPSTTAAPTPPVPLPPPTPKAVSPPKAKAIPKPPAPPPAPAFTTTTLGKIGGTQYQLDYVANVINTQYYNVPYSQRWW